MSDDAKVIEEFAKKHCNEAVNALMEKIAWDMSKETGFHPDFYLPIGFNRER